MNARHDKPAWRGALGVALLLLGLAWAAWRGIFAIHWFEEWRRWRIADPSAAELYQIDWWVEAGGSVIGLLIAGFGARLLVRRR